MARKQHRFPNLASMKLSAYWKAQGAESQLLLSYDNLEQFDQVFISKVFTETPIEDSILKRSNVKYGGTGFFYDKAPFLSDEIEHIMPDYHLYDEWISGMMDQGFKQKEFTEYTDYSIGFTTRGVSGNAASA